MGLEPALLQPETSTYLGALWQEIVELLGEAEYQEAATRLYIAQAVSEKEQNQAQAAILAAAHQICIACDHHHEAVAAYRDALEAAAQREEVLQEQLLTLLFHLSGGPRSASALAAPAPDSFSSYASRAPLASPRNWNRLQPQPLESPPPYHPARREESKDGGGRFQRSAHASVSRLDQLAEENATLSVYCLGSFRVYENGRLIDGWTGNKSKSILKYMVTHRQQALHRDVLIDRFWRADDPEAARRSLYQTIYVLRQALQGDDSDSDFQYILCENSSYLLNPDLDIWVDSDAFLQHVERGQSLEAAGQIAAAAREYEAADNLYEGDFLAEDLYEEWPLALRENLKVAYLDVLDRLSRYYCDQGQFSLCVAYCQKILQVDACREDAHRRLMRTYMHQGQRHLALRQYHRCVEALHDELDVEPASATRALYQKIKDHRLQI